MPIIYEPKGKAREYSPLAANLYSGCNHQCKYCYAPRICYKTNEQYFEIEPRRNLLFELEKDCKYHQNTDKQVLLTFMSDPYNKLDSELRLTREAIKLFNKYNIPFAILSKSKSLLSDIDLFKKGNCQIGMTLTFDNDQDSLFWEKEASLPLDRIETLKTLKKNNIKTWASFEPVIKPDQSINMIEKTLEYVDIYKIGKINNYQGLDKQIDWNAFLDKAVTILRAFKKPFYIKHDLRLAAEKIKLYGNECKMDEFNVQKQQTQYDLFS